MHSRDRTLVPAADLPAADLPAPAPLSTIEGATVWVVPSPLPDLKTAFSRRLALFGPVLGAAAAMWVTPPAEVLAQAADARLVALADAYEAVDRQVNATLSTAPGFAALVDGYGPIEDELVSTPAQSMTGVMAKARAMQVPAARECAEPELGNSLADDIIRLHAAGVLS